MIEKINLTNFKAFGEEEFDIAPLTLISGINGMGKSSIIQSLLLFRENHLRGLLQAPDSKVRLNGTYVTLETAGDLKYDMAESDVVTIRITMTDGTSALLELDASASDAEKVPFKYESTLCKENPLYSGDFVFFGADRQGPQREYGKSSLQDFSTKYGIRGELVPAFMYQAMADGTTIGCDGMMHGKLAEAHDSLLASNVNAWLSEIMGVPTKAASKLKDKDKYQLKYTLTSKSKKDFVATQVGFGFTYTLPIIVSLLVAKKGDLLIFENPEAHLHPSAQSVLGKMIAKAVACGVQVIMESHSDHILNSVRAAIKEHLLSKENVKIIFVQRAYAQSADEDDFTYVTPIAINDEGRLSQRPPKFFDTWDEALSQLV